jgi:hypothetical protein
MTVKPNCDYCWRPSVALVRPKRSLFHWRTRWTYMCRKHLESRLGGRRA